MSRMLWIGSSFAFLVASVTSTSWAQGYSAQSGSGCGCCGVMQTVQQPASQSYQRFSYQPSAAVPQGGSAIATAPQPTVMAPVMTTSPQVQSYRRYSYQPSYRTSAGRESNRPAYFYPKTDPRRYQGH